MTLTVAICTWNRCELLEKTLEQFTKVFVPADLEWEMLIVDNNCTDGTGRVAASFVGRLPIRIVRESTPGLSHARNRALAVTKSEYILWTDDDVLVDERWMAEFADAVQTYPEAAAVGGPIEPWFVKSPEPDLCRAFPALESGFCGLEDDRERGPLVDASPIFGANMGFRSSATDGMRFDTNLGRTPASAGGGEESRFVAELRSRGGQLIWWPRLRVKHYVLPERTTLPYLLKYSREKGREHAALQAGDFGAAPRLLGVPRWLIRCWVSAAVGATTSGMGLPTPLPNPLHSGPPPTGPMSSRVLRLVWLRERMFLGGMLSEYRRAARRQAVGAGRV